ncbi:uncharacterized protein M6B38_120635 [Iris pallida]|uniref:Uncharacterized protein n=1 Tax=Iris pallida TaxID=29817 RepID=A0AAX6H9R7_IRIPA|nr:uncharacterized protein M6B38_120635 [Iris pallida]
MSEGNINSFQNFQPIFGEATADPPPGIQTPTDSLRPFLFHAHAFGSGVLRIVATDFHSSVWERTLTADQLDDLRDEIGIGGSWSEFLDYFVASLSSGDVKLSVGSGVGNAKIIAHRSKGLPRISVPLNRVMNSSANDAIANFSMALFKAFKNKHNDAIKEHESLLQLKGALSSEKERNESLQKQLDALTFNKRKVHKTKALDKAILVSGTSTSDNSLLISETNPPSAPVSCTANAQEPSVKHTQPTKISQRAAPVSRRAKVRGVSLQDTGSDDGC